MGKKLSKPSPKISKAQKKQFATFVQVLRPKVYITEISSFKRLVQELTGIGIHQSDLSPPPSRKIQDMNPSQEDGHYCYRDQITTREDQYHHRESYSNTEELSFDQDGSSTGTVETASTLESWSQQAALMGHHDQVFVDLLAIRDIESWLLDL